MFTTGETVGLVEWIIDDTCLVLLVITSISPLHHSFKAVYFQKFYLLTY